MSYAQNLTPHYHNKTPHGEVKSAPAICRAGYCQFSAAQRFTNNQVQSRAIFWCKSGKGQFIVNGTTYNLQPRDLYVLPWNRKITYLPDEKEPMYTGHIHVVPWYRPNSKWIPNVSHDPSETAYQSSDRSDVEWPGFDGVFHANINANDTIGILLDYTIRWYLQTSGQDEVEARHLGQLILSEIERLNTIPSISNDGYPEELTQLMDYIDKNLHNPPTVTSLAEQIGKSRSHILKLFRTNLGCSAKSYIIKRQMQESRELLISTTLPISEVGQSVGLGDPYHFSKIFRKYTGIAPSTYRKEHGPFSKPPPPSSQQAPVTKLKD